MAETLSPRPAATVLTLRDAPNGYEILMLRRNVRSDFMAGVFVFPGGGVDHGDADTPSYGLSDEVASKRLDVERGGLSSFVACLRELFEEAGLLIACDESGGEVRLSRPYDIARFAEHRRSINANELTFGDMMRNEGLLLDLRGLAYLSHWITPVGPPRRYDTRFFVAVAPDNQVATHDTAETVADRWIRPIDALNANERGEFAMVFPTIRNLQSIAHLSSAQEVLDYALSLGPIKAVRPQLAQQGGGIVIVAPGDEGYQNPEGE